MLQRNLLLAFTFLNFLGWGQGYWQRVHGNGISNPPSAAGTFAPNNSPFGRYAAAFMSDTSGNFWLYGGPGSNDLWKYSTAVNQWMLVDGDYTGATTNAVYGTQGVEAPANTPGGATFGNASWAGHDEYLWMYGLNGLNDLWRYNTNTNMWAWMKGSASTGPPVYGTKLVPDMNNNPGMINETDCHWVDSNGDLWLYTEFDGNLWKYDVSTNMWAWMSGGGASGMNPVYGTIDVFDANNTPGGFSACPSVGTLYTMWITSDDHLWMIVNRFLSDIQVEMWEFDPTINQWRCRRIDTHAFGASQQYPTACQEDNTAFPIARTEMRADWVDNCDHLYMFGGLDFCNTGAEYNDIWRYDPETNNYTYLRGGSGPMVSGVQGVFDAANDPPPVGGSQAWQYETGFYLMGGQNNTSGNVSNDVWLYWPDTVVADYTFTTNCLDVNFTNNGTTGCNEIKSIKWDFGDGSTSTAENPNHTYSGNGTYTVTLSVTNCSWHTDTITKNVTVNCGFSVSLENDTICQGDCIDLVATTTSNPDLITFDWDNGIALDNDTVNVCPSNTTTFTVIATDVNGDMDTAQSTITVLSPPQTNLGNDTTLCGGGITLDATHANATYLWQDGSNGPTFWANNTGYYWVEVSNGYCASVDSIYIEVYGPQADLGNDSTFCSGSIILDATSNNVTYQWQDGSNQATYVVSDTGLYYVTVTDGNGCSSSDSVYFDLGQLNINLGSDTTICLGEMITLNAGSGWNSILWSTGAATSSISVGTGNTYGVDVTQGVCSASDSITIVVENPNAQFSVSDTIGCSPQLVNFQDLSSQPNIQSWYWDFGDGNTSTQQHPQHSYGSSGSYQVLLVITTTNGCSSDSSRTITVDIVDPPQANFSFTPDQLETNTEVQFTDESVLASSWYWDFGDGLNANVQNPTHSYSEEGSHSITLVASNDHCSDTASGYISVDNLLIYYVPNAFTPDGDQHNNTFKPVFTTGYDPQDYHLTIFNRWGQVLFESYNSNIGWDGTYPGCGTVKDGVYVWQIEFGENNSPDRHIKRGHVTLLK